MIVALRAQRHALHTYRIFQSAAFSSNGVGSTSSNNDVLSMASTSICIWGSNTGVGKTLFSAGLADACTRTKTPLLYLKPLQTGFPIDSDSRLVASVLRQQGLEQHGTHAAELLDNLNAANPSKPLSEDIKYQVKTLYAWTHPVSPHIAVEMEGRAVSDADIVNSTIAEINTFSRSIVSKQASDNIPNEKGSLVIVETAGGVASPGPNWSLQSDLLRPLRLPGLLVGDGKLGGISATITAYESLLGRGYDVPLIVLMDPERKNYKAIQRHVGSGTHVIPFEMCLPPDSEGLEGFKLPELIPGVDIYLKQWLDASQVQFDELLIAAHEHHSRQLEILRSAAQQAKQVFWWPFTQHGNLGAINVVESRAGERYAVFTEVEPSIDQSSIQSPPSMVPSNNLSFEKNGTAMSQGRNSTLAEPSMQRQNIQPAAPAVALNNPQLSLEYDAAASWWTQGLSQDALPSMARAVGYATARYGHIIFPQTVHQPALQLAQQALQLVGGSWASRVFFSDDGSTAVEVALKMAFRKYAVDHGLVSHGEFQKGGKTEKDDVIFSVLGLQEAYHGDTLGAMDAVAPSPFNGPLQTPWFTGRGIFLDPPTLGMKNGMYRIFLPPWAAQNSSNKSDEKSENFSTFGSLEGAFSDERGNTAISRQYKDYVEDQIDQYLRNNSRAHVAACIMEPVLQGAGGMRLIDPEFQRAMATACKARGIPVILDEVFTGFWRLGVPSAASMLRVLPDIACYAKLLTGGVVPMSLTLASEDVFKAFEGDSKAYALLHGHSYTAHPIGCAAGVHALNTFSNPLVNPNICTPTISGRCCKSTTAFAVSTDGGSIKTEKTCSRSCGNLISIWNDSRLVALSHRSSVERVISLGTVTAVELKSNQGAGYSSSAASVVVAALKKKGIISRPLGNVVYVMVTPMTDPKQADAVLRALEEALDEYILK